MSFRWPNKDPDERLDYSVDWERYLQGATVNEVAWYVSSTLYDTKTRIEEGETLTAASGNATTDSIQNVSETNTSTVTTINIGGGQNNVEYTFFCQMRDSTGSLSERSIKLRVKER
jgi:hypothetical protein